MANARRSSAAVAETPAAGGGRGGRRRRTRRPRRRRRPSRTPIWSARSALTILRPDFEAAQRTCAIDGAEMRGSRRPASRACSPCRRNGLLRGQSALINVAAPADDARSQQRRRPIAAASSIVKSPVAQHVAFSPGAAVARRRRLSGIAPRRHRVRAAVVLRRAVAARRARVRRSPQGLAAAGVRADARRAGAGARAAGCRSRSTPAKSARSCARSTLAKEFKLDPIIVGGLEASTVVDDLKAANARVIYSVNFQAHRRTRRRGRTRRPGRRRRHSRDAHDAERAEGTGGAREGRRAVRVHVRRSGRTPADFVRNVARTVKEGGLPADAALRALTVERREDRRRRRSPRHDREGQDREPDRHRGRSVRRRTGEVRVSGRKSGKYQSVDKFEV